jgi:hypothetical protein
VRNEEVLLRINEQRNILHKIRKWKANWIGRILRRNCLFLLPGPETPLMAGSFGPLNDLFPFPSILDAGIPIFDLYLANVLFDVILPSVLGSSL